MAKTPADLAKIFRVAGTPPAGISPSGGMSEVYRDEYNRPSVDVWWYYTPPEGEGWWCCRAECDDEY